MQPADDELDRVASEVLARAGPAPETFGRLIRQAIDEVLDGPRTGRFEFDDLETTEKTYIGTKLEIIVRAALDLERGPVRDLEIAGVPVDHKWAHDSDWMIPPESRDEIVLCVGGRRSLREFQVGLVRCSRGQVKWPGPGGQRDRKGRLSPAGRAAMRWLVPRTDLPQNFLRELEPKIRDPAMREATAQRRVTKLFTGLLYKPVPRDALRTVALVEGDPVRRVRQDRHAGDPLEGIIVISNHDGGNEVLDALGHGRLKNGFWMAIKRADLEEVPHVVRRELSATARRRFGFDDG